MIELREAIFAVMQAKGINAELPLADATEEMAPVRVGSASNPGQRTPSKPGGRNTNPATGGKGAPRASQPPKMPSQAPRQPTKSGAARSHSGNTRPPVTPKSNTGMIAGVVIGVLVLGGGRAFLASKSASDRKEAEEKQRIAERKAA